MPAYDSSYTGVQIDTAVGAVITAQAAGGIVNTNGLNTILGDYLTTSTLNNYITKTELLDLVYPVGAIYISINNVSPATLFGGTWEQIQDKFLLSAGSTYTAGSTGGVASHTHDYGIAFNGYYYNISIEGNTAGGVLKYDASNTKSVQSYAAVGSNTSAQYNSSTTSNGVTYSSAHYEAVGNTSYTSNLPPYLTVYMWKRTA